MIDIRKMNQAIYDTLKQVAPPDFRYVLVMWSNSDPRAAIASNEMSQRTVERMLAGATIVVSNSEPSDYIREDDEVVGRA